VMPSSRKGNLTKRTTFAGVPYVENLRSREADIAILGIPYRTPDAAISSHMRRLRKACQADSTALPAAVREESQRYAGRFRHYDFDFGGDLFAGRDVRIVDCGDVPMSPRKDTENQQTSTDAVRKVLHQGALPVVLGGDHATTIFSLRAYKDHGPVCVVHIDAHLDFRDDVNGFKEAFSTPLRRASEMAWVQSIAHIGLRGIGSARQEEVDAARTYGSVIIGAEELHRLGVDSALARVPQRDRYYITLDADGLDPSLSPGVLGPPAPGGVTYYEMFGLMRGIARKGKVVGFDYVEIVPALDFAHMTSVTAVRVILNLIGILAHEGQIGR
jgi:agmatinase